MKKKWCVNIIGITSNEDLHEAGVEELDLVVHVETSVYVEARTAQDAERIAQKWISNPVVNGIHMPDLDYSIEGVELDLSERDEHALTSHVHEVAQDFHDHLLKELQPAITARLEESLKDSPSGMNQVLKDIIEGRTPMLLEHQQDHVKCHFSWNDYCLIVCFELHNIHVILHRHEQDMNDEKHVEDLVEKDYSYTDVQQTMKDCLKHCQMMLGPE